MSIDVSTAGVRTLKDLLDQLPSGEAARVLASRLGLWTKQAHDSAAERTRSYPTQFSRLGDGELSDANAFWLSEAARATELVGLLEGQKAMTSLAAKQARAQARARIRAAWDTARDDAGKPVKYTSTQVADEAEADPGVIDQETRAALLQQVIASAGAYKEACFAVVQGISREISFRQAQYGARLR